MSYGGETRGRGCGGDGDRQQGEREGVRAIQKAGTHSAQMHRAATRGHPQKVRGWLCCSYDCQLTRAPCAPPLPPVPPLRELSRRYLELPVCHRGAGGGAGAARQATHRRLGERAVDEVVLCGRCAAEGRGKRAGIVVERRRDCKGAVNKTRRQLRGSLRTQPPLPLPPLPPLLPAAPTMCAWVSTSGSPDWPRIRTTFALGLRANVAHFCNEPTMRS